MSKLYLFMMISTDGYFEAPGHDINWHNVDAEFVDFAVAQLEDTSALVFGRRTYELMAGFWPTDEAPKDDSKTAKLMNELPKVVFSHSLESASWENTKLYHEGIPEVINRLKSESQRPIAVLGSSNLCLTLMGEGLLDELRLMVNPVVLGSGTPLFAGLKTGRKLSLDQTRKFASGNILLTYSVKK